MLLGINILNKVKEKSEIIENEYDIVPVKDLIEVDNISTYVTVENIVNDYVTYNSEKNTSSILNILSDEYKENNNISEENLFQKLEDIKGYPIINITDMKQNDLSENITSFFVVYNMEKDMTDYSKEDLRTESNYVALQDNTTQKKNCKIIVNIDNANRTFSIMPEFDESAELSSIDKIEINDNNEFIEIALSTQQIVEKHVEDFKKKVIYNAEESYQLLDEEYKNKRFGNIQKYIEFLENNKEIINSITVKKYKENNEKDEHTEYICIDQYGNYYIFNETGAMNYTVKLDTYTIDTEEFINKYNNGSNQVKVGMNLAKVFEAINRKDYEYVYNKLDNNFKKNNFPTLSDFQNYIKNNFFDINKIEYGSFNEQSGVYIYNVILSDAYENDNEEQLEENKIQKYFIIKLEDNFDFSMAFKID